MIHINVIIILNGMYISIAFVVVRGCKLVIANIMMSTQSRESLMVYYHKIYRKHIGNS